MDIRNPLLALAIAAALAPAVASATDPAQTGALSTPANRIVGVWLNQAFVGHSGGTPSAVPQHQTLVFHAGGPFLDNSRFPPQGTGAAPNLMQRSIGVGTWTYSPRTGRWSLEQRFDWFRNNVYDGYQVIVRPDILLGGDGRSAASSVEARRYGADGTLLATQCGRAVSTRM